MPSVRDQTGQATVEVAALLPLLALVAAIAWQAVVAAQAVWLSGAAARAAARAEAIGLDRGAAARRALPARLEHGLRVSAQNGGVVVRIAVPAVVGDGRLGTVSARALLQDQRG
ncbi:MAG TPA: hypothetical protein VGV40_07840 [Solirubrobacteraceae bacterium]|nr:hypothetical protein [Solirubrobacteraceae bacterium]